MRGCWPELTCRPMAGEGGPLNWPPSADTVAGNGAPLSWRPLPTQWQRRRAVKGGAAARGYAKALMDLARRGGIIAAIGQPLQQHEALLRANVQLQRVLENPSIDVQAKTGIMTTILERTQPLPLLRNFLLLLVEKDRMRQLDAICQHYERMANEELHRIVA